MRLAFVVAIVAGCTPEVPAEPSFQQDVMPILAANCVRCHGDPAIGGAPRAFRLDAFDDVAIAEGEPVCGETTTCGAASYASLIAARVRDERAPMPPRFPLDDWQIETLERWAASPVRGAPREPNAVPVVVVEGYAQVGALVTLRVRVDDPDGDLVAGTLRARVGTADRLVGALRTGTSEVVWDATGIALGAHALTAAVDDGAQVHTIQLGTVDVGGP
jgi:hypothetical protein